MNKKDKKNPRPVLAEGEVTGHFHELTSDVKVSETKDKTKVTEIQDNERLLPQNGVKSFKQYLKGLASKKFFKGYYKKKVQKLIGAYNKSDFETQMKTLRKYSYTMGGDYYHVINTARKNDAANERMILNLGPQHPATHGTLRLQLELDGERITRCIPDIGYLHTGFEKLGEHHNFNQFVTVTDRMNYLSPLCNNIAYSASVERLMGLEVPERANAIRVILWELSRIADHVVWLGTHALDIGAFTVFLYTFEQRERCYNIFELVTGARLTTSYTRIGGLGWDVPENFREVVLDFTAQFPHAMEEVERLLTRNRIWIDRTKGVGVISAEDAIDWNMTGPMLRGSGVDYDIRKAEPYLNYADYDFDIPVGENGDTYDRYLVRMEEMNQSVRIIEQAVNNLPGGPVKVDDAKVILPEKKDVDFGMESLIHHFKVIMDGLRTDYTT